MKRSQTVFVTAVFTAVAVGILVERSRFQDPFGAYDFTAPRKIDFDPLVAPLGDEVCEGRVLTHDGRPAQGVVVHLFARDAGEEVQPLHWGTTDSQGRFRLTGLAPLPYRALLLQPGHPNARLEVELPLPEPLQWVLPPPYSAVEPLPELARAPVLGRLAPPVTDGEQPVENYEIVFRPEPGTDPLEGAVVRRTRTDERGDFRLTDLVVAPYRVQVLPLWASGGSWPVLDEVRFEHLPGLDDRLLLRLRSGEIGGRLVDTDGRPIQGALIETWPEGDERHPWPVWTSDEKGIFVVRDLPLGRYTVRVQAGAAQHTETVQVQIGASTELRLPPLEPSPKRGP